MAVSAIIGAISVNIKNFFLFIIIIFKQNLMNEKRKTLKIIFINFYFLFFFI